MTDPAAKRLAKAERAIRAAETLLRADDAEFAAGRAYYAMFYAAEAALTELGLRFRKHGAVHAAFGERLAKPGLVDVRLHRWLLDAFDQRSEGDYGAGTTITAQAAAAQVASAREFVRVIRAHLEK